MPVTRFTTCLKGLAATLLTTVALILTAPAMATDGEGYREVKTDVSSPEGKVLVQEFFWYGCPHCHYLEAELEPWLEGLDEDVIFERRALALGEHWLPLTRAFYAAEQLDAVDDTHAEVFHAIHEEGTRLTDAEAIADFYAEQGVDRDAFLDAYEGFGTQNAIRKTNQIAQAAQVRGVPALLVDGRYLVTGRLAGGNAEMLDVVDSLIEQIRDERD
ncbi:MAG: thiol:disulfide interchange protein DsbA/DsbL [Guyparkeria sp.]|uniref:thiol:disulfide interchange protein DsbA/DsbL n=1 Tax=Guyparkeria sp. TaxID=2035736 RepID=UPI00397E53A4